MCGGSTENLLVFWWSGMSNYHIVTKNWHICSYIQSIRGLPEPLGSLFLPTNSDFSYKKPSNFLIFTSENCVFQSKISCWARFIVWKIHFYWQKPWPQGYRGHPKKLNILINVLIFGHNIVIWHARPPKNYRFTLLPRQENIWFLLVKLY